MNLYFSNWQLVEFVIGLFLIASALYLWQKGRAPGALILLLAGVLFISYWVAGLDEFLCLWDEQYHALVAKNLLKNPLKPMLFEHPVLDYNYRDWTANHIWLHKPPLFLWMIALSLKIFGTEAWAVRLPSLLMHALGVLLVFRLGSITINRNTGFYGAVFYGLSYHLLELAAGKFPTDHNDSAFLFFVLGSLWSWAEYEDSGRKWYWAAAVGIFAGCAVLVKWLVGLLVYAVWTIAQTLPAGTKALKNMDFRGMIAAILISFLIFIPWQIYVWWAFPLEARYEMGLNTAHFFEAVEGHGGDVWFHFRAIRDIYGGGEAVPYLLAAGGLLMLWKGSKTIYKVGLAAAVFITYAFYTAAATKMTSFCVIVAPIGFLWLGLLAEQFLLVFEKVLKNKTLIALLSAIIVFAIGLLILDLGKIQRYHTSKYPHDNMNRVASLAQLQLIEKLKKNLNGDKWVIFDADIRLKGHITVMFFTDFVAYDFVPTPEQVKKARTAGYQVAVLKQGELPEFLILNKEVKVMEFNTEAIP
jgi:4-amino-4-deoxy-L-arabinose transferase